MKRLLSKPCLGLLTAFLAVGLTGVRADAARVELELSSREVYVGVPFQIRITTSNGAEYEAPRLPAIDGLRSLSNRPSTRSETNILQGRKSSRMVYIYQYEAVAPGRLRSSSATTSRCRRSPPWRVLETTSTCSVAMMSH